MCKFQVGALLLIAASLAFSVEAKATTERPNTVCVDQDIGTALSYDQIVLVSIQARASEVILTERDYGAPTVGEEDVGQYRPYILIPFNADVSKRYCGCSCGGFGDS